MTSRRHTRLARSLFFIALVSGGAAALAAAPPQYQLTDLSLLGINEVSALNNVGDVVGHTGRRSVATPGAPTGPGPSINPNPALPPFDPRGSVVVARDGQLTRVLLAGAPWDINDAGQIIGAAYPGPGLTGHSFFFDGSTIHDLSPLVASESIIALNNAGTIIGNRFNSTNIFTVAGGTRTDLGTLGAPNGSAAAINDAGIIVGGLSFGGLGVNGFIRATDGTLTLLPPTTGYTETILRGVNNAGQVVGYHRDRDIVTSRAFIFQNGSYTDIGLLPGTSHSVPGDMNDLGQVVGAMGPSGVDPGTPFLFSDGALHNLNDLLAPGSGFTRLESALAINNRGQFIGYATRASDGASVAILATPVAATPIPLPAAATPAVLTLAALAAGSAITRRLRVKIAR